MLTFTTPSWTTWAPAAGARPSTSMPLTRVVATSLRALANMNPPPEDGDCHRGDPWEPATFRHTLDVGPQTAGRTKRDQIHRSPREVHGKRHDMCSRTPSHRCRSVESGGWNRVHYKSG